MKSWEADLKIESFYSGGKVIISDSGEYGFSMINSTVVKFDLSSYKPLQKIGSEILNFAVCGEDKVITYGEDDMLRLEVEEQVAWKSCCSVVAMDADPRGLLVTGGGDNSVRVYQILQGYLTHKFKHKQPVTAVSFIKNTLLVVSASLDTTLKIWDLQKYNCLKTIETPESVRIIKQYPQYLVTATNTQIIRVNLETWKTKSYDCEVTAMDVQKAILVGDSEGNITKLNKKTLSVKSSKQISNHPITCITSFLNSFFISNEESSVYILNPKLHLEKEFIGHIDEVLDIKSYNDTHILLALNSTEAKILNTSTLQTKSLIGHTDNILCTDIQNDLILTGSKDKLIKLWRDNECIGTYTGHTEEVTSVAFSKKSWFVSCSIDLTIKTWKKSEENVTSALYTCVAHTKDISVVKVSSDNKIIFSGSQDKSIKLWTSKLKIVKELLGHKRGVWDLSQSPQDRLLCSSSGDMTVKLWSLDSYECVRTLEGNSNSILKAVFVNDVLVSASSDGLIKVWDYKHGTCFTSIEAHNGKIWGLAKHKQNNADFLITGATDSMVVIWKDVTEIKEAEKLEETKETIKLEQDLQMSIKNGHYVEAAIIAFRLKRPQSIYNIVTNMNQIEIANFVDGLIENTEGLSALMAHLRDWNCFKKYSSMAQRLMFEVFDRIPVENFSENKDMLEAVIVYSQKHFKRAEKLYQESFAIEHLMNEIAMLPRKSSGLESEPQKKIKVDIS